MKELILQGKSTLEDLMELYERKNIAVLIEDGVIKDVFKEATE